MSRKYLIQKIMQVAEHYKNGELHAVGAMTDIGILIDDYIITTKSCPDINNYDYLRGFADGYGGEEPHDVFPDGFKDINEVWNRIYELKNK